MARGSRRSRRSRYSTPWLIFSLLTVAALIIGLVATLTPSTGNSQPQPETPPVLPSPLLSTVAPSPTPPPASTATPTATLAPPGIPLPPTRPSP